MADLSIQIVTILLQVVLRVYDILSLPFYIVLQQPWTRASRRIRAKPVDSSDKEITYRTVDDPGKIYIRMLQAHVDTLEKMFRQVTKIHKTKRCLGTREILGEEDEVQPNGKVFKKLRLGEYKWRNYQEAEQEARHFGRGMRELGIQPLDKVVMFAETRAEWMIAAHGLFKQCCAIVTIYATLGDEGVTHGITETEVKTLITSQELLPKIRNILKTIPNVDTIVYFEDQLGKPDTSGFGDVRVVPYSRVVENGVDSSFVEVPPSTNDIAFIMYTSGSTGNPKGVLLSHQNCIATMECYCDVPLSPGDVGIGFLPLAHVFELLAESVALLRGIPIGYSSPNTLLDNSSKVMRGCQGDANVLQPSAMTIVPLILDRISKTIDEKLSKATPMQKAIFDVFYKYKLRKLRRGFSTPVLDYFIFKKMARVMGGNLRIMLSGGAPLSPETHDKIRVVLCCAVAQGYGLTETTAGATITSVRDTSTGRVGAPSVLVDIKLVNWEEGNYRVTNKPYPQGEVIIGGETVSPGYYKLPEKTAEDFYDDNDKRWFRTGDIGEMHPDGVLKIIDRKKDLVKLQAGEYVSLGKVEAALKTCQLVENICVYGESSKHYCIALVLPNPKFLQSLADSLGVKGEFEDLCANQEVMKAVLKALHEQAKKSSLQRFEIPEKITLCSDVWSPTNGLLTAAFKIKRRELQLKYQEEITKMYSS